MTVSCRCSTVAIYVYFDFDHRNLELKPQDIFINLK